MQLYSVNSSWNSIPDDNFLANIYRNKIAKPTVEAYYQALEHYIDACPDGPNQNHFAAIDHKIRVESYLDALVDFDEPLPIAATANGTSTAKTSYEKKPSLTQEQLIAEIEQLIDDNPTEAKLQEVLPFLAKLAGLSSRDVLAIYQAKLNELEMTQPPDELQKDLSTLLAIAGESLNLYEYLPISLSEPLTRLSSRMAIRSEALLLALLTAVSSLHKVGTNLEICAEDKFFVPPNLFAGLVAASGQKKSPILRTLIKWPLDALEREANKEQRLIYEQAIEEWQESTPEERKEKFPKGEPTPTFIDYYFSDGTVEGVNRQFERFPERGMLYLRDELAGVFAFDKYRAGKGTERQDFLSFYDGIGKKELRADGFPSRVKDVLISIFGTIQPDILRQLMDDPLSADGQWSRFLFVIQPLQPAKLQASSSYDINTQLLNPLYKRIDRLPVMHYKLSSDAFTYYERHYNQLEVKRCTHPDPAMQAVFAKAEGLIGRLALNLHVIHELDAGRTIACETIPKIRMQQACKLMKFFLNQIKLLNATVKAGSDDNEIAPNLAAIVERSHRVGAVSARDIKMSVRAFREVDTQKIRNAFRQLEGLGYGTCKGTGAKLTFTHHQTSVNSTSI